MSSNIGWAPGAVIVTASEYARAWGSAQASAYNVLLDPNESVPAAVGEIRRALAPSSGLSVQTAQAHASEQNALSRRGLQRLTQIATSRSSS